MVFVMGITRKIKNSKTVIITISIATVSGYRPLIGFSDDVEKAWEQLKRKHKIKQQKRKTKNNNLLKNSSITNINEFYTLNNNSCLILNDQYNRPQRSNTFSDVNTVLNKFRQLEAKEIENKKDDVYSKEYKPKKYSKMDSEYGRPKPGTLSEARAKKASKHIAREMLVLCEVITDYGKPSKSGKVEITFKELFNVYTHISDKVVGILLRARKHKMVDFEGEMLFQRRDDHVIITCLLPEDEIKKGFADLENTEE